MEAEADEALEVARLMAPGSAKNEALKKAGVLRAKADAQGVTVRRRGRPPK
jgi:hypothetical protein